MNKSLILGNVMTVCIFMLTAFLSFGSLFALYDQNSVIIVFGGTFGALIFSFKFSEIKKALKDVKKTAFSVEVINKPAVINQVINLAKAKRKNDQAFDAEVKKVQEPFLRDAASLLFWTAAEVSADDFRELLETRANTYHEDSMESTKLIKTLTKFPPAFGMMGTVMGLIAMMTGLSDPNAKALIGPAMAVALMTTLYGIALNNLLFVPLAEHMLKRNEEKLVVYDIIIEGIMLIQAKRPTKYIEEKLLSFLTIDQRTGAFKKKT